MRTISSRSLLQVVLALALSAAGSSSAQASDMALFSASGGAPPNILILLDSSGSMGKPPGACPECDRKRDMANRAVNSLVTTVNPPDGDGGYVNNARFGFAIFTKDGARLLVPVGEDTVGSIVTWVLEPDVPTAADVINDLGGNSHGLAMMEMGRYFAHPETWAGFPPWGFASDEFTGTYEGTADDSDFPFEDPTLDSVWDLACRPTFLIHIDDGLWGGNDGGRFGDCDGTTCALANIGDLSGDGDFWMEDISLAMFEHDFSNDDTGFDGLQNIVTYVIGFDEPAAIDLMRIVAELGGGSFFYAQDETDLENALLDITINIFESVASFASVAVPSSRSSSGDSLYNAYFEPRNNQSIWAGHLEAFGLADDGSIIDKDGDPATDDAGSLLEPHNPFWDAGSLLADNETRTIYTTVAGARAVLNSTNVSIAALAIQSAEAEEPEEPEEPPEETCPAVAASIPAGWDFQLIEPDTLPDVLPDTTVKVQYCVAPSRDGLGKDVVGTFPVDGLGTDAIELKERKKDEAICTYAGDGVTVTGGHKSEDLLVGKEYGQIHVRYYMSQKDKKGKDKTDLSPAGLVGYSVNACVIAGEGAPPEGEPTVDPDFVPYPNSSDSGIDTYEELQTAVIDFAYGKDAFDQDDDDIVADFGKIGDVRVSFMNT